MASSCYTFATTGFLLPSRPVPTPLALRRAVLPTDMTRSSVINSQFFAAISSCSKVGAGDPYLGHIVMGGRMRHIIFCLKCGTFYWFYCIGHMRVCWCGSLQFSDTKEQSPR